MKSQRTKARKTSRSGAPAMQERLRAAQKRLRELGRRYKLVTGELRQARDEAEHETKGALQRQTATSEVLASMSASIADTKPVFDAIAGNVLRLFGTRFAVVQLLRDGQVEIAALQGEAGFERFKDLYPRPLDDQTVGGMAMKSGRVVQFTPILDNPDAPPATVQFARSFGFNSVIAAPMVWEGKVVGAIVAAHQGAVPFDENQRALLRIFADQAVIAIQNSRLFNETREALEQQTATAEILRVISHSPTDTQPVFEAIVKSGLKLFPEAAVAVALPEGNQVKLAAIANLDARLAQQWRHQFPFPLTREYMHGVAIIDRRVIDVPDVQAHHDPALAPGVRNFLASGYRGITIMPMVRGDVAIGTVSVVRLAPGPLTEKQMALLRTFADQAVIAIENVRLFNETREALERQTATAEILRVISGTPTDTQPVFDAIVQAGLRVFAGTGVGIALAHGDRIRVVAAGGKLSQLAKTVDMPLSQQSITGTAMVERRVVNIRDTEARDAPLYGRENGRLLGFRSMAAAPMLRDGVAIGAIAVSLEHPGGLSGAHLELLQTFADQAVIAIENVRLFNETKEALDQQKASAEVLRVISSSPSDLSPVFEAILSRATGLCEGDAAVLWRFDGSVLRVAAHHNTSKQGLAYLKAHPLELGRYNPTPRAALERRVIHEADVFANPEYRPLIPRGEAPGSNRSSTQIAVPLLSEDETHGVITIWRFDYRPFSERHVMLLQNFADQAVIAIENVRLFNETTEALEQQKASGEVLQAISSSIADTAPVFDRILDSCQRLLEGHLVGLTLAGEDGMVRLGAYKGDNKEETESMYPMPLSRESGTGWAILDRKVAHFADVGTPGSNAPPQVVRGARTTGFRSIIFAPLLSEGVGIGALWVARRAPGPFSPKQTALLQTFAEQAVIAIQNARLFREIQEKSHQLEIANKHKSEFLANMSHELRTPLNAIIGFTRIVMRRSKEQLEPKQYENLEKILMSGQNLLALINAILDLSKVEAGRVEVHPEDTALAPVLEQCLRTVEPLVKADAVKLVKEFDGGLPQMYVDEEKLRQIVINLLSNAAKFTASGSIRVRARAENGSVDIAVADTGIGIPADKIERIFEEFEQADASSTRVYGGTGLGLTIARRLARLMGGDIRAESTLGSGSTFTLTLPTRYEARP